MHREKGLFLSVYVDGINMGGKKDNLSVFGQLLTSQDFGEPSSYSQKSFSAAVSCLLLELFFSAHLATRRP